MVDASRFSRLRIPLIACMLACAPACAMLQSVPLDDWLGGGGGALDESTVAAGLKEALRVGAERTVAATSMENGFFGNPAIRIPIPERLESAAGALRRLGLDRQVDELEEAMNRAAERAARESIQVLWDAVSTMTVGDAFRILEGHDTAATEYFRERTEADLMQRFRPIVEEKMAQVGLARMYEQLMQRYTALPFVREPTVDLEEHVAERALDGLFATLAREERRIREDPAARTTELLRRVFRR